MYKHLNCVVMRLMGIIEKLRDTVSLLHYSPLLFLCVIWFSVIWGSFPNILWYLLIKLVFLFKLFENSTIFYWEHFWFLIFLLRYYGYSEAAAWCYRCFICLCGVLERGEERFNFFHSLLCMPGILVQNQLSSLLLNRSSNSVVAEGTFQP